MLDKHKQTGAWHFREAAKLCCTEALRDAAMAIIPLDQPLTFYEGMIETCFMHCSMSAQIAKGGAPDKDSLSDLERYNLAIFWALADIWEKKVGRKFATIPLAAGHG